MGTTVNFAQLQYRLNQLREKTLQLLNDTDNGDLAARLADEIDQSCERKELRLAFVGQYSSGKSTIISALTGRKDIKIDANVATDTVTNYHWNNIVLMDTPGILAGKVEAHDERTKDALKECDLIFYVLTSQLFDDVVFENFIDLAYNQHFADKMFIVVNKMGMEAGDFEQLSEHYTSSLDTIFSNRGYNVNDFPIAFIDAADFIEGKESGDEEFVELSNFGRFIDMLNAFVAHKGIIKKQFDTPVRILQSYLKNIVVSSIDKTLSDFYSQFESKLNMSMRDMKRDVGNVLSSFDSSMMSEVITVSQGIGEIDQDQWNAQQIGLDENFKNSISDTSSRIEETINMVYERLIDEMDQFGGKDAIVKFYESVEAKINSPSVNIEERKSLEKQRKALDFLKQGAKYITNKAPGVTSFGGGISQASGSALQEIVKKTGHFFGKNFKPWQATRWAANIAKFAKFGVPIITTGLDLWMQNREERKESERQQQIKNSRDHFITHYQTEVNKVKSQFEQYLLAVLENYETKRQEVNRSKNELAQAALKNEQLNLAINTLEGEYIDFIEVIEGE